MHCSHLTQICCFQVNAVIATDIFDPALKRKREERWSTAFPKDENSDLDRRSSHRSGEIDRKAALVFETIITASDVAHMMQRKFQSK